MKKALSAVVSATFTDCSTRIDGDALLAEPLDDLEQLLDDERREAERQLVDHEERRLGEERHRQREHLLLTTGELRGGVAQAGAQHREEVECLLGRALHVLAVAAVDPHRDLEVLRRR